MRPICVPCQRFFRPKKNNYPFVEGMQQADDTWTGYKLWLGDLWECKGCGAQIVVGVAHSPLAEHYQSDFVAKVKREGAELQVNDC